MTDSEITRLTTTTNAVVVQLAERQHPGVVIQGDSLANLCNLLEDAVVQLSNENYEEAKEVVNEVQELLTGYLAVYKDATKATDQ